MSGVAADHLVLAMVQHYALALAFLPIAAAMVYGDMILAKWSERENRAYSRREMLILEGSLLALLCLLFGFLRLIGGEVELITVAAPFCTVAVFRVCQAFWFNRR